MASVVGLLLPALDEGSNISVGAGLTAGVAFLLIARHSLRGSDVHSGSAGRRLTTFRPGVWGPVRSQPP